MRDLKIAIIGCGNIGSSIANGLIADKDFKAKNLTLTKRNLTSLEGLKKAGVNLTSDNIEAVKNSNIIIIGVKPYMVKEVIAEIREHIDNKKHTVISLATGFTTDALHDNLKIDVPIYRVMPNIAAEINESMTCVCHKFANEEQNNEVEWILNKIGKTLFIKEDLMEAATVLGACGIAYALRFIRGMIQGGIQIGFDAKTANAIVNQTVKGAAELLIKNGKHPEVEIDKVTTPKGYTIIGLNEMEHQGFSSSLIKGILASYNKIEK
jgi:pyrroline-5-carboxylate reductase